MPVERCVCFNVTFVQLRDFAKLHNCTFDDLRAQFGCGRGCSLCVPYIKAMLATGRTSFPADESPDVPPGADHL